MLRKSIYVITLCAHAALAAVLDPDGPATARKLSPRQADGVEFNPTLEPFVRVTPSFWFPYNVTTPTGVVASIPNCQGGTVTGAFEADILPAGTSFEQVAPDMTYGEHTFYENRFTLLTSHNETIPLEVNGIFEYGDRRLRGAGYATFRTTARNWGYINYRPFVFEVYSNFGVDPPVIGVEICEIKRTPREGFEVFDNIGT